MPLTRVLLLCAAAIASALIWRGFAARDAGAGHGGRSAARGEQGLAFAGEDAARTRRTLDLAQFRGELERLRGGEEGLDASLDELARRLAGDGRPDVARVLAHYRVLGADERRAGVAAEAQYAQLWQRIRAATEDELSEEEWRDERALVLGELDALIAGSEQLADRVPAARMRALRARLKSQQAEHGRGEADDARERLLSDAERDALAADAVFEAAGFLTPRVETLWVLAQIAIVRQREGRAEELLERCRALAVEVANDEYLALALGELLTLARARGDVRGIAELLHGLAEIDAEGTDWIVARGQAQQLLMGDHGPRAVELLERAAPAAVPGAPERDAWAILCATALAREGRYDEAERVLRQVGSGPANVEQRLVRVQIELQRGRFSAARQGAAELLQQDLELPRRVQARELLGAAELGAGDARAALATLALALAEDREREQHLLEPRVGGARDLNVQGEVGGLQLVALYAEASLATGAPGAARQAALAIEQAQARELRRAVAREEQVPELSDADLAAWAARYEGGLLTWVVGADVAVVVHVARDGSAAGRTVRQRRVELERAARRLREALLHEPGLPDPLRHGSARATDLAREIQDVLLGPELAARIAAAGPGRVLCLVHGALEGLALESWPLFADGRIAPLCLPGLPERRPGPEPLFDRTTPWRLVGAPLDAEGAELLPGARAELEGVRALYATSVLDIGARFDRGALEAALTSGEALHLATHASYGGCDDSGRFANAGLELAGGETLCARAIVALRPAPALAFLSVCESGGGRFVDAQGLQGIARAFLESGTRNLVVTLWPVEDGAARDFALGFHRALLGGRTPARAAAEARAALARAGRPAADWAAFRALGRD